MDENVDWHARVYKKVHVLSGLKMSEWRILRDDILRRDNWTCQRCETRFRAKKYLTVHHIKSRANGGSNDKDNLITLCDPCHNYVECNDLNNYAAIIGSIETEPIMETTETVNTDWHSWVYGGGRNPMMDSPRKG